MNFNFLDIVLVGPSLFLATALIFSLFQPGYRSLHQPISELALGRYGYVQTTNFVVNGLLIALLGVRLLSAQAPTYSSVAIIILGSILLLSAIFRTDPVPTTKPTTTGLVHNLLFFVGMLGIISGQFVTGFNNPDSTLGTFSLVCGALTLLMVLVTVTRQTYMGIFQRGLVLVVMSWVTVFALSVLG